MEIRSFCSIPSTLLRFRPRDDQHAVAVICKVTYRLAPVHAQLSPEQEPIQQGEKYYDDASGRSVERPNDVVPYKPRAEIMLVGSAFVPQRRPVRNLSARMIIGDVDKAVEVHCQRMLNTDGSVREGMSWISMPLRYERTAGGPETWNPVGVSTTVDPAFGTRNLPQIVPVGYFASDSSQAIPPAGFGPISSKWPIRSEKLGQRAATFSETDCETQVLGSDFDANYFQAAPRDQQVDVLRADERIVLENLHSEHARLVTSLPGLSPAVFFATLGAAPSSITMRPDTLWIDTDRRICTLTFRGHISLRSQNQAGIVYVLLQEPDQRLTWADVEARIVEASNIPSKDVDGDLAKTHPRKPTPEPYDPDMTSEISLSALPMQRPVIPFGHSAPSTAGITRPAPKPPSDDEPRTDVYDAQRLRAGIPADALGPPTAALDFDQNPPAARPVLPFARQSSPPPPPTFPTAPPSASPPMPPPFVPPPVPGRSGLPGIAASSPTSGSQQSLRTPTLQGIAAPPPVSVLQRPPAPTLTGMAAASELAKSAPLPPAFAAPPSPRPIESSPPKTIGEMVVKAKESAASANVSASEGVLAASNAAAEAQDKPVQDKPIQEKPAQATSAQTNTPAVDVIWFDNAFLPRIRARAGWAPFIRTPPKAIPQRGAPPPPPPSADALAQAAKADIAQVLSRAAASQEHELMTATTSSEHDGSLHLLSGTLTFPLDEIELLKATSRAAAPLAGADKKLKEVLDAVEEVLKMPLEGAPEVVQGYIVRVREAWSSANRVMPPDYLLTHPERTLLNQRQYQKRELLDDEWIRALYSSAQEGNPIPTYVPAKLAKRLPLFRQFAAKLIVEALPQQDMYESHPLALRVVALARVLTPQEANKGQQANQ